MSYGSTVLNTAFFISQDDISRHTLHDPVFRKFFILSLSAHALLVLLAGTAILFRAPVKSYAPAYTVDLVTLSPSSAGKGVKAKVIAPVVSKHQPAVKSKTVHLPSRPEKTVEKNLPTVIRPPQPTPGDETARMERQKNIKNLEEKAARLYESFRADETAKSPTPSSGEKKGRPASSVGGAAAGGPPVVGTGGGSADLRFKAYYDRIWGKIRAGWAVPNEAAARENHLLTVVGIRISATGIIESMKVERESGNIYYDQYALRAISKASPLPPLPEGLGKESLEVGINFRVTE